MQPPEPVEGFHELVGYLLNAGVDVAFGPGDVLPNDLPPRYDGIRAIVVCMEDLPRLRRRLHGFRGLDPDGAEPIDAFPHGTMFLHEDDRTWLAVYTAKGRRDHKRIENPLLVAPELTVDSPRLRERLLARPDRDVHGQMMEALLATDRFEWSDVTFGTLWAIIGAHEATGETRWLDAARRYADRQLEWNPTTAEALPRRRTCAMAFLRLSELTGDLRYRQAIVAMPSEMPDRRELRVGGPVLLQAHSFVHPTTREHMMARAADGGTYSEQVGLAYPSHQVVANAVGRGCAAADRIEACLAEHRRNCRDERTGLYYHGMLGKQLRQHGVQGHGMLWTCFGLVHLVEHWPHEHPAYGDVLAMFQEACAAAARVQDPDTGGFHHILDIPQTPYARIYTPALAYVFLRGARLGLLPPSFREPGRRAWEAVKAHVFQSGNFGGDSGTPQSRRLEFYLLQPMTYDYSVVRTRCFWQLHAANEALRLEGS